MRVVEPRKYDHMKPYRSRRLYFIIGVAVFACIGAFGVFQIVTSANEDQLQQIESDSTIENQDTLSANQEADNSSEVTVTEVDTAPPLKTLRIFAGNDFRLFYDQLLLPNLIPVQNPPEISGNTIADARIRKIAESRGYKLRSSPSSELSSVDGYPVQQSVVQSWLNLKAAAAASGYQISIVSSYRSVEHQRSLFLSRLSATGATIDQVAQGLADDKVDYVLVTSSIPGYSKHHTGYTLDILCAGWGFENFKNSPCNTWISADNFKVAKENGFIPSYPPDADAQGPDPEAWEYVWVGTDLLYQ